MKLPLFIILTGMVTILFAGVTLKKKSVENPYKCVLGLEDHKAFLSASLPTKWTDATKATHEEFYIDTLPKQSYIQFQETGTSIFHNGVEVALRRKNGTWKVVDSRKAMEVMYQNIYTRDSVRRSK